MSITKSNNFFQKETRKETIRELASRHLKDPNHTTTDEEIRNATVVIDENINLEQGVEEMFEVNSTTLTGSR